MTQAILATILRSIKAKILGSSVPVKKVDVRSIQVSGEKVTIPNGLFLGATPDATTSTAITLAEEKEETCFIIYY